MQKSVNEDRDKYIGGSDIPIIMGISPFKTRFDLLLEKAGLKENDFTGNEYTEYGNVMESKIRDYVNKLTKKKWETPSGVKITLVADGEDKVVRKFNEQLFKDNNLDLWDEYSEEVVQKGKVGYVKITLPKKEK